MESALKGPFRRDDDFYLNSDLGVGALIPTPPVPQVGFLMLCWIPILQGILFRRECISEWGIGIEGTEETFQFHVK
jgi:hypothetical protein